MDNLDALTVAGIGLLLLAIVFVAVKASGTKIPLEEKDCPRLGEIEHFLHALHFAVRQENARGTVLLSSNRLDVEYDKEDGLKTLQCTEGNGHWSVSLRFKHGKPLEWWSSHETARAFVETDRHLATDILKLVESKFEKLDRIKI